MCGIFLCLKHGKEEAAISPQVLDLLRHRGPDNQRQISFNVPTKAGIDRQDDEKGPLRVTCLSSVLALRGDRTVEQPVTAKGNSHGEQTSFLCWNGEAWSFGGTPIRENDSDHVFATLSHVLETSHAIGSQQPEVAVSEALAAYAGPYAFVFYDKFSHRLFFGRDFLGRRSLLVKQSGSGYLQLSSVPDSMEGWLEIEADGIYWIDLDAAELKFSRTSYRYSNNIDADIRYTTPSLLQLRDCLRPREVLSTPQLLTPESSSVGTIHSLLKHSLQARLLSIPHRLDPVTRLPGGPARVAVLFSGGIDCTLLARISSAVLDPRESIDLLNVAFENPRVHRQAHEAGRSPYDECPDRKTAASSLKQLQATCSERHWRLVRINVPYEEFAAHRGTIVSLIYPHNTEMDLSIAAALYFAARGRGILDDGSEYETPARVLLSGLGADELFGGYSRHAAAFQRGGLPALQDELALDISRLGKRNLGRDDRVISHWAKEARFPFLDEHLLKWSLSLPLWEKCGFGQAPFVDANGDEMDPAKLLLRCLGLRLGLGKVANEKKRAIQFGARTAKMETNKSKGTHLLSAGVRQS